MTKTEEAVAILKALGLPRAQQNERSALTLLALLDLREESPCSQAIERSIRIHDILAFILEHYHREYAENTRETIRRQTLHQLEQAGVAVRNPDDPTRPTNSPKTVYAITPEALVVITRYGTPGWDGVLQEFVENQGKLIEKYEKRKEKHLIPVSLPNGCLVKFSPGKHNELQAKVLKEFRARFCPETKVAYVGDAARKLLHANNELLQELQIPITQHDKLPDVVLYDRRRNHVFLIEAVTAHGPLSPKRQMELEEALKDCKAKRIYVTAFPDFREFRRHIENIAWGTEVWIENNPEHVIHFNGPEHFTVYAQ